LERQASRVSSAGMQRAAGQGRAGRQAWQARAGRQMMACLFHVHVVCILAGAVACLALIYSSHTCAVGVSLHKSAGIPIWAAGGAGAAGPVLAGGTGAGGGRTAGAAAGPRQPAAPAGGLHPPVLGPPVPRYQGGLGQWVAGWAGGREAGRWGQQSLCQKESEEVPR